MDLFTSIYPEDSLFHPFGKLLIPNRRELDTITSLTSKVLKFILAYEEEVDLHLTSSQRYELVMARIQEEDHVKHEELAAMFSINLIMLRSQLGLEHFVDERLSYNDYIWRNPIDFVKFIRMYSQKIFKLDAFKEEFLMFFVFLADLCLECYDRNLDYLVPFILWEVEEVIQTLCLRMSRDNFDFIKLVQSLCHNVENINIRYTESFLLI